MSSRNSEVPTVTSARSKTQPIPTNTVTTKDGNTVRTRIDASLSVADVIHQLCTSLKLPEPPHFYALRDDNDELVVDENLRRMIRSKANLRLVSAPNLEAIEIVETLYSGDTDNRVPVLRLTLFNLAKFIKEEQFADEFLRRDGLTGLIKIINGSHGNMLAYALSAMQNLMELDHGWEDIDAAFIYRIVQILASPQSNINVCRPASAILRRLVEADPRSMPGPPVGSSQQQMQIPEHCIYRYGFEVVFTEMTKKPEIWETVVGRLGSQDSLTALNSMMLINSLLSHATDDHWEELASELERHHVRRNVTNLMSEQSTQSEDLTSSVLDFQANFIRILYKRKTTPLEPAVNQTHAKILQFIWLSSKMQEEVLQDDNLIGENGGRESEEIVGLEGMKWRLLGFESENLEREFEDVGVLGLDCLRSFVVDNPDYFAKVVLEQNRRLEERRCPVARASNEVVELLSDHWSIYAPGYSMSTTFQPFLLEFSKVHALATQFFLRMWNESGAAAGDFMRVAALVRSQIKVSLRHESTRPWHEVPGFFLESEYRDVRDRQMKELELEDDLSSKVSVRNLRATLFKESFEFVKHQRFHCLMQGAWFINGVPTGVAGSTKRPSRPWRFLRLDNSMKYLHYTDSPFKFQVRNGFEDLQERIDVSAIQEIAVNSCTAPPSVHVQKDHVDLTPAPSASVPSSTQHSFSLLNESGVSLADQVAVDASRWADWTDGLNMLRKDGGHVATAETAGFVHALTEIGLKIRLLDLTGEKVDIPSTLTAGPPPPTADFFFSDIVYDMN